MAILSRARALPPALLVALCVAIATGGGAQAQEHVNPEKAAKVKAAYLLNFVRYSQWPEVAFDGPGSPIVITEIGACDVHDVLSEVVRRSGPIGGRPVELRNVSLSPNAAADTKDMEAERLRPVLASSHLVYVCSPLDRGRVRAIVDELNAAHVLTVGDTPDFVEDGGMLGFVLREGRVLFEANPKAIQTTAITVSAKVLKLAQIVTPGGQ